MPTVLLTRPHHAAHKDAKALEALGYHTQLAPMLSITHHRPILPPATDYAALILTSPNALPPTRPASSAHSFPLPLPKEAYSKPVFCVGHATAHAAKEAGFTQVITGGGDVRSLVPLITARALSCLYLRGTHVSAPLERWIQDAGLPITGCMTYTAQAAQTLPPAIQHSLTHQQIDSIMFTSARCAEIFTTLIRRHGLNASVHGIKSLSISPGVLEYTKGLEWKARLCAAEPTLASLREALLQHCPP